MKEENIFHKKAYGAYALNQELIYHSSSGAVFPIIVNWFMEKYPKDFYIAGVIWKDDFRGTRHVLSNQLDIIEKMKISKYIQSDKEDIFLQIKRKLDDNKHVLFTGCPCEVAGLKSFLGREYENLVTLDFICKGTLSPMVMEMYLSKLEHKYHSQVKDINLRYKWEKMDVWIPQFMRIEFKNGKILLKEFYHTELGHAFRIMQRMSCYQCKFLRENKVSELTMGDFHGANKSAKYYNPKGTSAILLNNQKGKQLFEEIRRYMVTEEVPPEEIFLHNSGFKVPERDKFGKDIAVNGLNRAIKRNISFKEKLKMKLPFFLLRKLSIIKNERSRK